MLSMKAALLNLAVLCGALGRKVEGFDWRPWLASIGRTALATAAMVPVVLWMRGHVSWLDGGVPLTVRLLWLAAMITSGTAVFGAAMFIAGGPDVRAARVRLRAVVRTRGGSTEA